MNAGHRGAAAQDEASLHQIERTRDMDIRTGRTYDTREDALTAGVPPSDIAEIVRADGSIPEVRFASGPFKGRTYKRMPSGQLVRTSGKLKGYVEKSDGRGEPVYVKG